MEKRTRLFTRDFMLVMGASMSTVFVNWFFNSTRALYVQELTGGVAYVGYIVFVYSITALALRFISGPWSDRIGKVKIMTAGAALCLAACILYGILDFSENLWLLLALQGIHGIGFGAQSTCSSAIVPDIVPPDRIAEGVGASGLGSTIAQAVGPMIALFIVRPGGLRSFQLLFFVSAAVCLGGLLSGVLVRHERKAGPSAPKAARPLPAPDAGETGEPEGRTLLGFDLTLFAPTGMMILYHFGTASITILLPAFAASRAFDLGYFSLYFVVNAGGIFLSRLFLGKIADRRGGDIVVIPSLLVITAVLVLVPLSPSLPFLIALALPMGVATGAVIPAVNAMMFRRASPKRRGAVSGAFFAAIDVAFIVAGLVLTQIADRIGYNWVFWLSALLMGLAFLAYFLFVSDRQYARRRERRGAAQGANAP